MLSFIIETCDLVKKYGQIEALRGLNIKVSKGAFGLIGPNAAGKSTTVKILLGLVRASGGEARVFGLDVRRDSFAIRKRVGVLHEKPSFPGWVKGLEYVEYLARLKGVRNPRAAAFEELKSFGLGEACERKIGTYSAGMVQRLGLAQAFVGDPELVFLDEPTANLDPLGRAEFLDMIKERCKSLGVSVVISTHILSELERVCNAVAIIFGGVALEMGSLSDLFEKYSESVYGVVSSDDKRLMDGLAKLDCVERVWFEEGVLMVKVKDQGLFERDVIGLAHGIGVSIRRFEPVWWSLEHVYKKVLEVKGVGT
jgi:ABC-2 type transport system ATP-binding protein